ncbi:MAG TPA: 4-hydroxy-tetrahydrodipicolinate reductase [Phycisphaerales bacterium]|nr:4-hydroxy-tetrahydrodipicolinate reductase [Phycisphaerales bacterium]
MKPRLIINGSAGRMGRRIVAIASETGKFDIVAAVDCAEHPDMGTDAGILAGIGEIGTELTSTFPEAGDVVIDFSLPQAADKTIEYCAKNKVALVIGTTGLTESHLEKIRAIAENVPVIQGTNMGVGMNALFKLAGQTAKMLGEEYDIEIVEAHHRFKKDAPSGSALTLAENIAAATDREYPDCLVHGREGGDSLREAGTIGMHSIRAGDITGEHSVIFSTLGETITLSHSAHSRDTFVRGAVRAALWLVGKEPGLYSMADVLGL